MLQIIRNDVVDDTIPESALRAKVSIRGIFKEIALTNYQKALIVLATSCQMLSALCTIMVPLIVQRLIDSYERGIDYRQIIFLAAIFVMQLLFNALGLYLFALIGAIATKNYQQGTFNQVLQHRVGWFEEQESTNLANKIYNNIDLLRTLFTNSLPEMISGVLTIVGIAVVLLSLNWALTIVTLFGVLLMVGVFGLLGAPLANRIADFQDQKSLFATHTSKFFRLVKMIKANAAEKIVQKDDADDMKVLFESGRRLARINALINPLIGAVMMLIMLGIFGYGGYLLNNGSITNGVLIAFLLYVIQIMVPLGSFSEFFHGYVGAKTAMNVLMQLRDNSQNERQGGCALPRDSQSDLVFKDVNFAYDDAKTITLDDINMVFKPNTMTAIVGPSGAGKTTIVSLIEQFYAANSGVILSGTSDITQFSLFSWRQSIGYISQKADLLGSSLRDYLSFGRKENYSDNQIKDVLGKVGLLEAFNGHLDDKLLEDGNNISGGQLQRLAIAQAILKEAGIYIFDESTANLDADSEMKVKQIMEELAEKHIVIAIAHRLSTIKSADNIYFLEDGTITGSGTHSQLLANHKTQLLANHKTYARYVAEQML
ncbi:ABC transporter ATP-binding protein [Oenococcus kitaharae]|uniref:Multidrug resistance ABC transporter n=1 Tax=Oenococcus kitaharae DSM 17330 TaxID=1045004 RepID=G9WIU2_9LACO|nr:ABC transporter ATP-binding protein [Oenococcus kitaharae]EHN58391.1 Multidrug resistance ABC transporter [Oenococcus kitaharae DSM 17330]OEY81444.1 hypothetical protein NT95_08010 [Oenococcus kitaharae]OEY82932.1 hypothetical protein NV75_06110 [Oenococcus kitaharae]OEY84524.1 hypothetical protein NT96_04525 [Oenococcus kitaharae]